MKNLTEQQRKDRMKTIIENEGWAPNLNAKEQADLFNMFYKGVSNEQ